MLKSCFGSRLSWGKRRGANSSVTSVGGANEAVDGRNTLIGPVSTSQKPSQQASQSASANAQQAAQPSPEGTNDTSSNDKRTQSSVGSGQATGLSTPAQSRSFANASRLRQMDPQDVTFCNARSLLDGIRLKGRELGRGSYGVVVPGTHRGIACAVKFMLSQSLDRAALRELLLGPNLVHQNIVRTFATRCAILTEDFFDFLEGGMRVGRDPTLPRVLEPLPINSGEGFGDPRGLEDGSDPTSALHNMLHSLKAETNMVVVVVVQEYCNRGNLETAIRRGLFKTSQQWSQRIARRAMLRTATEAARGLLHLHDCGVAHGDFKPANVLLTGSREDRRGFEAKVADFGLSQVLPHTVNSISTECTGSIAYMAPEALDGKVSRATDVWSFGVTLWEMLTSRRPYYNAPAAQAADVVGLVREGQLELVWPSDPRDAAISELGRRCLSRNPQERPTMAQVVEELVGIERILRAEVLAAQMVVTQAAAAHAALTQAAAVQTAVIAGATAPTAAPAAAAAGEAAGARAAEG